MTPKYPSSPMMAWPGSFVLLAVVAKLAQEVDDLDLAAEHRAVTGVLASHRDSRDVHIIGLTITFHGAELLTDSKLELNCGRRYGLIGLNGCGGYIKPLGFSPESPSL